MKETKIIKKVSKKNGTVKYEYYVDGVKVRTSGRIYVASTANGEFFWGRAELIGKGYYTHTKEQVAKYEAATLESIKAELEKNIAYHEAKLKKYQNAKYAEWLYSFYSFIKTMEEAKEHQAKDIEYEKTYIEGYKKELEPEALQKELEYRHGWAEGRNRALQIVRYDINNIIEK